LACDEDWNRILNAGPKGRWCVGGAGLTAGLVNADPVTDRSPHLCRSTRGLSSVTGWMSGLHRTPRETSAAALVASGFAHHLAAAPRTTLPGNRGDPDVARAVRG